MNAANSGAPCPAKEQHGYSRNDDLCELYKVRALKVSKISGPKESCFVFIAANGNAQDFYL